MLAVDLNKRAHQAILIAGCDELSILEIDPAVNKALRVYTTLETVFPLYGKKELPDNDYTRRLILGKDTVFIVGMEQMRAAFPDYKRILGQGISVIVNVPIVQNSVVVGSLNCMYASEEVTLPTAHEVKHLQKLFADKDRC